RAADDAAIPAADRVVELVGEDRRAPHRAGRRLHRGRLRRGGPRRSRLLERAKLRLELVFARACLVELALERARPAARGFELLGEPRDLGGRSGLQASPQPLAVLRDPIALCDGLLLRAFAVAERLLRCGDALLELD